MMIIAINLGRRCTYINSRTPVAAHTSVAYLAVIAAGANRWQPLMCLQPVSCEVLQWAYRMGNTAADKCRLVARAWWAAGVCSLLITSLPLPVPQTDHTCLTPDINSSFSSSRFSSQPPPSPTIPATRDTPLIYRSPVCVDDSYCGRVVTIAAPSDLYTSLCGTAKTKKLRADARRRWYTRADKRFRWFNHWQPNYSICTSASAYTYYVNARTMPLRASCWQHPWNPGSTVSHAHSFLRCSPEGRVGYN